MLKGLQLIVKERNRQIKIEGWTAEHDASHKEDELARAAACYAIPNGYRGWLMYFKPIALFDFLWPWSLKWWKPSDDRVKELAKAGALIAAEIDRICKADNETIDPCIVCLCGSTRFYKEFQKANYEETMKGNIVLSVGFYPHSSEEMHGEKIGITSEQKTALDELHKRKIDIADEVLVINVDGYIGSSTASEIEYAMSLGKPVRFYIESSAKVNGSFLHHS